MLANLSLNLRSIVSQRLVMGTEGRRVPAVEVLLDTPRIRDIIRNNEIHELKKAMESRWKKACKPSTTACSVWSRKARST